MPLPSKKSDSAWLEEMFGLEAASFMIVVRFASHGKVLPL
jgi:hypothetical protein